MPRQPRRSSPHAVSTALIHAQPLTADRHRQTATNVGSQRDAARRTETHVAPALCVAQITDQPGGGVDGKATASTPDPTPEGHPTPVEAAEDEPAARPPQVNRLRALASSGRFWMAVWLVAFAGFLVWGGLTFLFWLDSVKNLNALSIAAVWLACAAGIQATLSMRKADDTDDF